MNDFDTLRQIMADKGYRFFSQGDHNLNLIGVRSAALQANTFNDVLLVAYYVGGEPVLHRYAMTTDPGRYYREHPLNIKGTAVLKPGQYRGLWTLGLHRGDYPALVQAAPARVWRDADGDAEIDLAVPEDAGHFGINLHRASKHRTSHLVDRWSAGCQVLANPHDFEQLMALVRLSAHHYGPRFTYTLLEAQDFAPPWHNPTEEE